MARNLQQNEQAREMRMEQIRGEALRQFAIKGLAATRIQDIAKGVGMAQGLLYHYYPSKESIYIDLVNDALDKTIEASLALMLMVDKEADHTQHRQGQPPRYSVQHKDGQEP